MEAPQRPGILGVWVLTTIAQGISFSDVETGLRILALLVPTAYTIYRWHKDSKRNK
jgi:hypothetical protein